MRDENPDTNSLQYLIGSIFTDMTCKFTSGYSIREVIDLIQPLRFQTEEDRRVRRAFAQLTGAIFDRDRTLEGKPA